MYGDKFVEKVIKVFIWMFKEMENYVWYKKYQRNNVGDSYVCQQKVSSCVYGMMFFYYDNK